MNIASSYFLAIVAIIFLFEVPTLRSNAERTVQNFFEDNAGPLRHLSNPSFKGERSARLPAARDLKYYSTVAERKLQTIPPNPLTPPDTTDTSTSAITGITIAVIVLAVVLGVITLGGGAVFIASVIFGGASAAASAAASTLALQNAIAAAQIEAAGNPRIRPNGEIDVGQPIPTPPLITRLA